MHRVVIAHEQVVGVRKLRWAQDMTQVVATSPVVTRLVLGSAGPLTGGEANDQVRSFEIDH